MFCSFLVPGGLKLQEVVQTSSVEAPDHQDLNLESLSKQLNIQAANDVTIKSFGGAVNIGSLNDITFTTKDGKVNMIFLYKFTKVTRNSFYNKKPSKGPSSISFSFQNQILVLKVSLLFKSLFWSL